MTTNNEKLDIIIQVPIKFHIHQDIKYHEIITQRLFCFVSSVFIRLKVIVTDYIA